MPRYYTPSESQLGPAKRLMSVAEIEAIKLVEGQLSYASSKHDDRAARKTGPLELSVDIRSTGKLLKPQKLEVEIHFSLIGRKGSERSRQLLISAKFELTYTVPPGVQASKPEIDAFANTNALLNAWPFWREFVQSSISRMGLPPLTLPLFRMVASSTEKRVRSKGLRSLANR